MRPVTDELLLGIAGVSATVVGLFLVGVFFYIEAGMRSPEGSGRAALRPYMRAGTRIVLLLFAMALLLSLTLAAFDLSWSRVLFLVLSVLLVAANVDTAVRVPATRVTGTSTLLLNEVAGSVGVAAIVVLPLIRGGLRPSREDLTLATLIALATAFVSVGAIALSAFDVARLDAAADQQVTPAIGTEIRALHPTDGVYPAPGDSAHAVEVRGASRLVFVAGTMGLDAAGVAGASIGKQLELVWSNLRTILAAADMTLDDVVRVTSYLRDAAYADENSRARADALGDRAVPTTTVVTETLADDWLVEIEVIAAA